jgi:hypothetical protein
MTVARLPGVRVVAAPVPRADALPRMDIALFVGFASAGPVHVAVAIDSPAAFQTVFGGDPVLAWDAERGTILSAALGPAVRAFFENGGRRAFVIRVCATAELQALRGHLPERVATANHFPIAGVLADTAPGAPLTIARGRARSLGSWSDRLQFRARCDRSAFRPSEVHAAGDGMVRFRSDRPLLPGDLVELSDADEVRRAYVRVEHALSGAVVATLLGRFVRAMFGTASSDGHALAPHLSGASVAARLHPGEPEGLALRDSPPHPGAPARLEWRGEPPQGLRSGHWLLWTGSEGDVWFYTGSSAEGAIEADRTVPGVAWSVGDADRLPHERAARVTLDLATDDGSGQLDVVTGIGLTPGALRNWWENADDDQAYGPGDAARSRPSMVRSREPEPRGWLPLGLGADFSPPLGAEPQADDALTRDGLNIFAAELFLDPRLEAQGIDTIKSEAERIVAEATGRPLGVHGVLAIRPSEESGDLPSIVALPDAVHPGWDTWADDAPPPPPVTEMIAPPHWAGHRGPCPEAVDGLAEPAFERFIDCATRVLPTPIFSSMPESVPPGAVTLSWSESEPDATYVLEQSASPDMAGAVEIARIAERAHRVYLEREGAYYFRLTAQHGDEVSASAHALVWVRASSRRARSDAGASALVRIHRATLRLAVAEGALFVLMALPRGADAAAALAAAERLREERGIADPNALGVRERRALSHGALLHGWLFHAGVPSRPGVVPPLVASPPCGAVAGVMARRTLAGGAWLSPANQEILGPVALAAPVDDAAALRLLEAGVMPLREVPRGFVLTDGHTLAEEDAWRPIGTRRLFGLLRRLVTSRAATFTFEPNGPVLHRAIERGLGETLLILFRAGAFAGFNPVQAFRVLVREAEADRDSGRLITEIAVAPSRPLAFLTVVLRQVGERMTFEEQR